MPFSEEGLKTYIIENFMNSVVNNNEKNNEFDNQTINYPIFQNNEKSLIPEDTSFLYKYLENDDLIKEIEYERDYYKQYFIHLCIYKIDQTSRLPFIKFSFIEENNNMTFPKIKLNMQNFIELKENLVTNSVNNDENDEKNVLSDIDKEFLDQVNSFYKEIYNNELSVDNYKGFLEENENIFVFLDLTMENLDTKLNIKQSILEEIIVSGNIVGIPIDSKIIKLFNENVLIQNLRTLEGAKIENPKIGYLIDKSEDNDNYENIYHDNNEILLIPPTNNYQENEDVFIFSSVPLKYDNISNICRYACFVTNNEDEDENKDENKDLETFLFQENNTLFYGIKEEDLFSQIF
tara:strand:+ start:10243 stop:11289 length:1047 start_codon:yes stop_codon:yes gene_type:complete